MAKRTMRQRRLARGPGIGSPMGDDRSKVFTGYRRELSSGFARAVHEHLTGKGYDVAMGVESLDSRDFRRGVLRRSTDASGTAPSELCDCPGTEFTRSIFADVAALSSEQHHRVGIKGRTGWREGFWSNVIELRTRRRVTAAR
jgi:hypothetical protein